MTAVKYSEDLEQVYYCLKGRILSSRSKKSIECRQGEIPPAIWTIYNLIIITFEPGGSAISQHGHTHISDFLESGTSSSPPGLTRCAFYKIRIVIYWLCYDLIQKLSATRYLASAITTCKQTFHPTSSEDFQWNQCSKSNKLGIFHEVVMPLL